MSPKILPLPRGAPLRLDARPLVMGILNVTPDSFSDGGRHDDEARAVAHGLALVDEGADILDIGGESTRPGHRPVDAADEIARVEPVIRALAQRIATPISIDTMKAQVAARAMAAGAAIINDVWGFQRDPDIARVAADTGALAIVMHNRETEDPGVDIVAEVRDFLSRSIDIALAAGVARDRIVVDPGFGFGKTHEQSLRLVTELASIAALGFPVLLGASRKRSIGRVTGRDDPMQRLHGSLALAVVGAMNGADILRAHDVAPHLDAMKMVAALHAQHKARP
ncbi:MAG: dihydropteroate synthase [Beijerinckiaceae bacterium]|nr:dihydropteroate synthase [Beijerinckiaceae bacterium]